MEDRSNERATGHITLPLDPSTSYESYAAARAQGPVVTLSFAAASGKLNAQQAAALQPFLTHEHVFVARYGEVVSTLADQRFSSDARTAMTPEQREKLLPIIEELSPVARSFISMDPPDHTRLRKLIQPSFSPSAMQAMRPRIQKITDELLDEAERLAEERGEARPNRRMNLIEAFASRIPATVICEMLGIPPEDRKQVFAWTEPLIRADRRGAAGIDAESRAKISQFIDYLRDLFRAKREHLTDDIISQLLVAEEDGERLSKDEVLSTVNLLYVAGNIPTVGLIGNSVYALLTHPEELSKVRADLGLARNAVEETLRYWGPVELLTRRIAKEDTELGGLHIPKGEPIMVGLGSANRDPAQFPDPDRYDVTREGAEGHVAFGKGIHLCVGAPLARLEGQIALETLLRRFPEIRLAVPPEEIRWRLSFMRGLVQLPVLF